MDQEKIWNYLQTAGVDVFSRTGPRFRFLAEQIDAAARVLNIGVGDGTLEALISDKGAEVWSLDPSEGAIQRLRESQRMGERAKVGYSQSIPFEKEAFDVVIMTEVLEHLEQEALVATLREVRRVLVPSGHFIGTVPAEEALEENKVVCPHCGEVFHRYGHVRAFSQEGIRSELSRQFEEVRIWRKYFADFRSLNWKGRLSSAIKKMAMALGIRGANENFYFSATNISKR